MKKMKRKVKSVWRTALDSGQLSDGRTIRQGMGKLRRGEKTFCCLGVLCEEAVIAGVIPVPKKRTALYDSGPTWFYGDGQDDNNVLPEAVIKWAGLETENPVVRGEGIDVYDPDNGTIELDESLSEWNDDENKSFTEISKMIGASL